MHIAFQHHVWDLAAAPADETLLEGRIVQPPRPAGIEWRSAIGRDLQVRRVVVTVLRDDVSHNQSLKIVGLE